MTRSNWPTEELRKLAVIAVGVHGETLRRLIPDDFREYGWDVTKVSHVEFYSELLGALCKYESNYKTDTTFKESFTDSNGLPVISRGLLQLSIESCNGYGAKLKSPIELHDPAINLRCGVLILSRWIERDGVIAGGSKGKWLGAARYWSPFRNPDRVAAIKKAMKEVFQQQNGEEKMSKYDELYAVAKGEMGVSEVKGTQHNKKIVAYHQATGLKAQDDETPWCASFVNWCLKEIGDKGTNSAAAISFMKWGQELKTPVKGCVVVFSRTGGNHVTIFDHMEGDTIYCLGGNQGNRVNISAYPKSRLKGFRGFADGTVLVKPKVTKDAKKALQRALNDVGVEPKLKIDGDIGTKSKAALRWAADSL